MKINWKLRIKNKATLIAMSVCVVDFIYSLLALLGIVPTISKGAVIDTVNSIVSVLVFMGIVVDPTTDGMSDSVQAMTYDNPKVNIPDELHSNTEYKG